jgi:hypothetical protein
MAEVLVRFTEDIVAPDGTPYRAQACGAETAKGMWQGWIEFTPPNGEPVLRSPRETTQPNRQDTVYWATGLTAVYLEGALARALTPPHATPAAETIEPSVYDGPAPAFATEEPPASGVLDPFSVYRKGEALLRGQLAAMSSWHLVNIIRAYGLSEQSPDALGRLNQAELLELIVAAVKAERTAAGRTARR